MEGRLLLQDIDIIKNEKDLLQLETAWKRLFAQGTRRLFLSYEWFRYVIEGYSDPIFLLIAKEGGSIKAIAPFRETTISFKISFLSFPVKAKEFILNPFSTFCDFISAEGDKEAIDKFIKELFRNKNWSVALFSRIPQDSDSLTALKEALSSQRRRFVVRTASYCPYVKGSVDWDSYLSSQSHNYKEMVRKFKKKFERLDKASLEFCQHVENVNEIYETLLFICKNSKKKKDKDFFSKNVEKQKLLLNLVKTANENRWLRLWIVKSGERPVAAEINLFYNNISHCVFKAHDENYDAYSVGSYLTYNIIKYCVDSGYEYDFGPGDLGYKLIWTKDIEKTFEFVMFNDKFYSKLLYLLSNLKDAVKKIIIKEDAPVSVYGQKPR